LKVAIWQSALLYCETWVTGGIVNDTKFGKDVKPEYWVLCLTVPLLKKADPAVLIRLCKDLNLTEMVKALVNQKPGFSQTYPKVASESSRLLVALKKENLKSIIFLARFHCACVFLGTCVDEIDNNLKHVVCKCLDIVESFASMTPVKPRGGQKQVNEDTNTAWGAEASDETVAPVQKETSACSTRQRSLQEWESPPSMHSASFARSKAAESSSPRKTLKSKTKQFARDIVGESKEKAEGLQTSPAKKKHRMSPKEFFGLELLQACMLPPKEELPFLEELLKLIEYRKQALLQAKP
jgi:hypothetical protein